MKKAISSALVGLVGCLYAGISAAPANAAACVDVTFGATFAGSYSCDDLGTPTDVTGQLGGVTFLNNNTLLIGGNANTDTGYIGSIGVVRDGLTNRITGFSGPSTFFADAPFIDGGLEFGPGGVLFATGFPNNTLLQFLPGSTAPDKTIALDASLASVGSLVFVPTGFAGAGQAKLLSFNNGNFADATLTADGLGTFDVSSNVVVPGLVGGPEGAVYIKGANAGFGGVDSILISEWAVGRVGTYQIDANGNPIVATRQDFLSGLSGAEGAVIDPLTGDFLFSTFGGGNRLLVISGFQAPNPGAVPEPTTWAMMIFGFGAIGMSIRRRKSSVALA